LTARLELRGIDWSQTAAFCHPADNQGYICLNLRGRERGGIVDPAEADALMRTIADGLATFCDPDGSPAVARVDRVAEQHDGARTSALPDLVVQWSETPATTLRGVHSAAFGDVERHGTGSGRSGNHTPGDAWAVVVPGTSAARTPTRAPRLADVATTVAAVCGVDRDGLAGEPLLGER
jgi:predicted AlkP superfamily phosphohydrolase/phosphomutase